ncbi:NADH-flavin reductase [Gilliamella apicola]|uniref:NAD(P)-dependent oxidoreductase n=1 Tax=Gilliamella TaxID=1193503 RepID=UPI0008106689|nr:NAD(P)-dependent oxidoreductase [Gilliamella apicola]OCF92781.1 NADH-flavin reductase [Gilliamella apicola]OTP89913.1 NADH-flavin reductase [Gilliamella apicola]OTP95973.1 NADH-flavin reductase [Gilliamella apicola]OTP96970.1 NADH-flavin reductase [Gilliamella apicola]OTQ03399.1 NADH-flavin reductase [Gilliamella apicola]
MKIAVIGANGKSGSLIVKEALSRGHAVTAIVRKADAKVDPKADVLVKDLFDLTYDDLKPFDVIVDAFAAWTPESLPLHQTSLKHLTDILSGKPNRLLVVGGAGSLYVNPELSVRLVDTPEFPEEFKPLATNMAKALDELKKCDNVNWTYLSPAIEFVADGSRTGHYTAGGEQFMVNSQGKSQISYADYAIAMVDEAENAKHVKQRFTVVAE